MTKETTKRIHRIYGIVLSVVAVITGICFIVSSYTIYQNGLASGQQPYTYATIGAAFRPIAVPVYLCLALVLGGWGLNLALPQEKKKLSAPKNQQLILKRLEEKTDLAACAPALQEAVAKQIRSRRLHSIICGVLLVLSAALFCTYALDGSHWPPVDQAAQITGQMVKAVFGLILCLIVPFIYSVFTAFYHKYSLNKQIELMRQANTAAPRPAQKAAVKPGNRLENIVRYGVLAFALCILVYGFCTGGTADVLAKAAAICTECVGLG